MCACVQHQKMASYAIDSSQAELRTIFIDQYEFVAMRTLSGRNTLHCEFCDQMMVSTWTVIEISLFEKVVWTRKEKERNGPFALLHLAFFPQRRSDEVDLCEINYLGSSLIDFCISIGKCSWLSLRRAPLFKSRFKAGSSRWKNEVAFSYIIQNQLVMTPGFYFTKSTLSNLLWSSLWVLGTYMSLMRPSKSKNGCLNKLLVHLWWSYKGFA